MTSLCLKDAASIVPFTGEPVRGDGFSSVEVLEQCSLNVEGDRVASVGRGAEAEIVFDASGCAVVPGFVDCHTHLPFFGWRADEDAARLSGVRYQDLHRGEGGIFRSARMLSQSSDDEVLVFCEDLAGAMLRRGTTTFEMKSGYGLSVEAELRQLRLAARLSERVPQLTTATCLAAHAVPPGKSQGEWVGQAATELLPVAVREGLASACDLYVESIAFALEHAARLAETAAELGLRMRIHADQLEDSQAGSFAARWGFASADHLNHTSAAAVADLAASDTVAVLLPGATFTLRQAAKPPARSLIESGAVVALGSDLNPGTSPVLSMPFVITLACRIYGLRPLEALAAATVNAAFALDLHEEVGSLMPGRRADAVVLAGPVDEICYRGDQDQVVAVVCGGELVHVRSGAAGRVLRA
ncbi:MAG: imidazolonepropionase [Actinomycetota bacterium]|nr:imidazolonepropionase [Actinomycetota bacterium]